MTQQLATFSKKEVKQTGNNERVNIIKEGLEYLDKGKKGPEDKTYLVLYVDQHTNEEDYKYFEFYKGRTRTYESIKLEIEAGIDIHDSLVIVETITLAQALSEDKPKSRMSVYNFMKHMQESGYFDDTFDIEDYNNGYYEEDGQNDEEYI